MLWPLPSGRIIQTVWRDGEGHPKFLEIYDTRSNARRIIYGPWWNGDDRSKSDGVAVSEADLPAVIDFFLEDEQTYWRYAIPINGPKNLIHFPGSFPWCTPKAGDKLRVVGTEKVYTVQHVPEGISGVPWNGVVLLDSDVANEEHLRWVGKDTRSRNLIEFHADDGFPESPLPGEQGGGDIGLAYRGILKPTISYLLIRQEPATIGPKPFGRDKELKPRIRDTFFDPDRPQVTLEIWGHRMENEFRFRCLHPQAAIADELTLWFKRFMRNNTPSMRSNGLNEMLFLGQDAVASRFLGKISARDIRYYFRTEELILKEVATIKSVGANFTVVVRPTREVMRLTNVFQQDGYEGLNPFTGLYDQSGNLLFSSLDIADYGTTGFTA